MLEVVLAQKPPAWLQVIYERLKHLIINSETFQNKKKRYMARKTAKLTKKIDSGRIRGKEDCKLGICPTIGQKTTQPKTVL